MESPPSVVLTSVLLFSQRPLVAHLRLVPERDEITRPELDAKLEAIEARLETKVTRIEGKLDLAVDVLRQAGTDAKSLKLWIAGLIVTVIIAAVSTVIGVYGANSSIVQSVIAAFESGRNIGQQPPSSQPKKP